MTPSPLHRARHSLDQAIEWAASSLYALAVFGGLALAGRAALYVVVRVLWMPYPHVLSLLDPVLFLMVLAELLHTLCLTIRTHHLPLRPLLALVFMALVRHAIVLTVGSSLATPDAAATMVGLVILVVLLGRLPARGDGLAYSVRVTQIGLDHAISLSRCSTRT